MCAHPVGASSSHAHKPAAPENPQAPIGPFLGQYNTSIPERRKSNVADSIKSIVDNRLDADGDLDDDAKLYVMAALDGTLDEVIQGGDDKQPPPRPDTPETPARAYLRRVSVAGFRGIGPRADLDVVPGPGLTLVVGANGTGKSSFAEGLEFLLTGRISRWAGKSQEWIGSWRNLHSAAAPHLQACFTLVDGEPGEAVAERSWEETSDELHDHTAKTKVGDQDEAGLTSLGWETALETHRPFLSHDRLSGIAGMSPLTQFDVMAAGLGLERLTEALERIRIRRSVGQKVLAKAREGLNSLRDELRALDDERGDRMRRGHGGRDRWQRRHDERLDKVRGALSSEPWNLDAIKSALDGPLEADSVEVRDSLLRWVSAIEARLGSKDLSLSFLEELALNHALDAEDDVSIDLLRMVVDAPRLDITNIEASCDHLRDLDRRLKELEGNATTRADRLHKILEAAVLVHEHYGYKACPVCETRHLDSSWLIEAHALMADLREEANHARMAFADQQFLQALVRDELGQLPSSTIYQEGKGKELKLREWTEPRIGDLQLTVEGIEADQFINMLSEGKGLREVADTIREFFAREQSTREALRKRAREELDRRVAEQRYREHLWHPAEQHLRAWLPTAQSGLEAAGQADAIAEAERWLTDLEDTERARRFRPIAKRAQQYWDLMGKGSSVSLGDLALMGRGTSRSLNIPVSVDAHRNVGLGVMSQGELNALSLSLFLARAMQFENPFCFLVIDDPVQAMDPTKVEGLARALKNVAAKRQVLVFTHDQRLPAVVRQLQIGCQKIEVTRNLRSVVQCRLVDEPVRQHLNDAWSVLKTQGLIPETRQRVIPGFCRLALEAACVEAVRVKRAEAGSDPTQTEEEISNARTLNQKLALVLLDDMRLAGEALRELNDRFGSWARDVAGACNTGSHRLWRGNPDWLVHNTKKLAEKIRRI